MLSFMRAALLPLSIIYSNFVRTSFVSLLNFDSETVLVFKKFLYAVAILKEKLPYDIFHFTFFPAKNFAKDPSLPPSVLYIFLIFTINKNKRVSEDV